MGYKSRGKPNLNIRTALGGGRPPRLQVEERFTLRDEMLITVYLQA